jgi:hypothetical protein
MSTALSPRPPNLIYAAHPPVPPSVNRSIAAINSVVIDTRSTH